MTLNTKDYRFPPQIVKKMAQDTRNASTVAALSPREPMLFGEVDVITFSDDLTAEHVAEMGAKSSTDVKPGVYTALPQKYVVQMRTSNEFQWADEAYQTGVLDAFAVKCSVALARALDLGVYFRLNPRTGTEIGTIDKWVAQTPHVITAGTDAELDLEGAADAVLAAGFDVNGIALDSAYAGSLSRLRYADGRKKFPDLGIGAKVSDFEGINASASFTVRGKATTSATTDNKTRAILGDFADGIFWGIQKDLPFRVLEFGDPDNTGRDLAGHNEVLLRTEMVYGWAVLPERFGLIKTA